MTPTYEQARAKATDYLAEADLHLARTGRLPSIPLPADLLRALLSGPPEQPCRECDAVSAAIGGVEFMDPPDGGDVSLSEQVRRMRAKIDAGPPEPSEEEVAAIQVAKQRLKIWDGYGGFNTPESVIDQANGVADALRAVLALFRSRING